MTKFKVTVTIEKIFEIDTTDLLTTEFIDHYNRGTMEIWTLKKTMLNTLVKLKP